MSTTTWLLAREQFPSARLGKGKCLEKIINGFQCHVQDEYQINGEMGMALPPFTAKFSRGLLGGHLLGVADEDGNIQLVDSRKAKCNSLIKGWSAHSNAVFDMAWVQDQPKLLTASGDQTARLWDVEKAETLGIFRGHTCSLKSINVQFRNSFVFATGARDGKIMIWDTRCHMKNGFYGPTNVIHGAHVRTEKNCLHINSRKRKPRRPSVLSSDSKQSVTAVVFQDENIIISSGACDGTIKIWDIRKNYSCFKDAPVAYHTIPYPDHGASRKHGYSSLVLDSTSSKLYATCINDVIYAFHSSNLPTKPFASFYGHQSSTFYIKSSLSPDDRFLLSGSGDDNCYVFNVNDPTQAPWLLKGHVGEVTSVAWCPSDVTKVATCSDDNTFRIWRSIGNSKFQKDASNTQIGACTRKASEGSFISSNLPYYFNKRVHARFMNVSPIVTKCKREVPKTPQTPGSISLDDSMSCTSASSFESPDITQQHLSGGFSTPRPLGESPTTRSVDTTPKNSRIILEKWLKSTPSPGSFASPSPESNRVKRNTLLEQNIRTFRENSPKRRIVLSVRPSTEPRGLKRRDPKAISMPLTRSSTKRKLVSDEKENPPSKTIKMCFASTRSSPRGTDFRTESDSKREEDAPSTRPLPPGSGRRPFASNRVRDILDHVDELEEESEDADKENSP